MCKYILIIILLISCKGKRDVDNKQKIQIQGNFNSMGLEMGTWKYFKDNNIIEEGYFEDGIRTGKWNYYYPNTYSLHWNKYVNKNISIITNIPGFLILAESNDSLIRFKNNDSAKIFNLVIGKNYSKNFFSYKSSLYEDLKSRDITLGDTASQSIVTNRRKYLYNFISGSDNLGKNFYIFNIAGIDDRGELIEISLRCEPMFEDIGRKVFFSILPSLFINSIRFIDQKDNILFFPEESPPNSK